jgi:hypothetical protein
MNTPYTLTYQSVIVTCKTGHTTITTYLVSGDQHNHCWMIIYQFKPLHTGTMAKQINSNTFIGKANV